MKDKDEAKDQPINVLMESRQQIAELELPEKKSKQIYEALLESEAKYRSLYNSSKDGISFCDMQGNILDANKAYTDMMGYTIEEMAKLNFKQCTPKKWHKIDADIINNQIMVRGYSDEYEKELIKKDGSVLTILIRVWLINNEQKKPGYMWAILRDITERNRVEKSLKEKEKELEIKAFNLEEVNTALRVLLKRRDEDKTFI